MHDEDDEIKEGDFQISEDDDMGDLEEIPDFGLSEEDPDKDH